jgi:putative DNA primase/helicase
MTEAPGTKVIDIGRGQLDVIVDVVDVTPDENPMRVINLTEDGLAVEFTHRYRHKLRYCHTRHSWYVWDETRWKQEKTSLAFHWARLLCREINSALPIIAQKDSTAKAITALNVEKFAKSDRVFSVTEELWNTNPWLIATPTGTIDLKTGELIPARQEDHITLRTSVAPEPGVPEIWIQFLHEATNGDIELQRFLQQIAGYCLTGITREHALFFLYGPGGNGKGVFVNTISKILDELATGSPMSTFTASKHDQHPTDLASLAGARMVTASETEEGRAWAESRIKQITGGDPVNARFMRQDFFQYLPQYKLVIMGNHKPVLQSVDDAARRRFNIVPFTFKPASPDLELEDKLKAEYSQILSWMIDGCLDWQEHGLVRPAVVTSATDDYFEEQDLFRQWLEECTEEASERVGERTTKLYGSWKSYAENAGDEAGSQRSFREKMQRAGFEYKAHLPADHNGRGFIRLRIRIQQGGHFYES